MENLKAPINAADSVVKEWVHQKKVAVSSQPATLLVEDQITQSESELEELWADGAYVSWLGGPAIGAGEWPHRDDGQPLIHIASISLELLIGSSAFEISDISVRRPPQDTLPSNGVLEIFHDLESFGYDDGDRASGSWLVRVVPSEERVALVNNQSALERVPEAYFKHVIPYEGFTLPSSADLNLSELEFEAYEGVLVDYNLSWQVQRGVDKPHYEAPTSHIYGHSSRGVRPVSSFLSSVLDCDESDLILIAEFESWIGFPGWFGDAGSLEVWISRGSLKACDFSAAWCMIRTD